MPDRDGNPFVPSPQKQVCDREEDLNPTQYGHTIGQRVTYRGAGAVVIGTAPTMSDRRAVDVKLDTGEMVRTTAQELLVSALHARPRGRGLRPKRGHVMSCHALHAPMQEEEDY